MKRIATKFFIAFLQSKGLQYVRTKGSHQIWDKATGDTLSRPVIIRANENEIPLLHIKTNLQTLGVTVKEFEEYIAAQSRKTPRKAR